MILTGNKIMKCINNNSIKIEPFHKSNVTSNSYNCTLGDYLKIYEADILDPKKKLKTKTINIPDEGLILYPDKLYLGFTKEIFGSNKYASIITGRSSIGRLGLFVQITSDLIDTGYFGQLTLQLHSTQPIRIYKDMKIGQVMFYKVLGKRNIYNGKYQQSLGPRESEIWSDF